MKISKTKAGIKIEGKLVGNSTLEKETYLSATKNINQHRPDLIRSHKRVKYDADLDIDIEKVKEVLKEKVSEEEFKNFEKVNNETLSERLKTADATSYNMSDNHNWGNKAIAGILNDIFNTDIFQYQQRKTKRKTPGM
jgi:ribosomal protein L20A (L18A)